MQIVSSKQKIIRLLLQIVLAMMLAISIICISKPIQVKAEGVEWIVDAEGNNYVYIPGRIYWGGSESRTGILFYCVDRDSGTIVEGTETILYNNIVDTNGSTWLNEVTNDLLYPRVGDSRIKYTRPQYYSELPTTGDWESDGGSPVKDWLEADSGLTDNGQPVCNAAKLVYFYTMGTDAYKNVLNGKYSVCFEGMYAMAMYKVIDGKDVAHCYGIQEIRWMHPEITDEDVEENEEKLAEYATMKYFTTLRRFVQDCDGRQIDITKRSSTANYKWIQSCAKYFSTSEEHFGIPAASKAGGDVTASEILNTGWNFAVIETSLPPIHTYYEPNGTPGNTEPPSPDNGTDGECTIKKLYCTETLNADGTVAATDYKHFEQAGTTNYISIDNEEGYTIEGWKTSDSDSSLTTQAQFHNITPTQSGTSSQEITLDKEAGEKYLYVLLKKTEITPNPSTPYDFRLEQSQITKRVPTTSVL